MTDSKPLISVIICSVNPEDLRRTESNLRLTAGVPIEVLSFDNRKAQWGICKVYNHLAKQAISDCLLFIHEDVLFESENWAPEIIRKLNESDTGVVGFAGGTFKGNAYSGWLLESLKESMRCNVTNPDPEYSLHIKGAEMKDNEAFAQVITVDGLAMFIRKDRWTVIPYDENLLDGFHCYDIDISLSNAYAGYKNYIWYTPQIIHLSLGKYDEKWIKNTIKAHDMKWKYMLPMNIDPAISNRNSKRSDAYEDFFFMTRSSNSAISLTEKKRLKKRYLQHCFTRPYYLHRLLRGIRDKFIN